MVLLSTLDYYEDIEYDEGNLLKGILSLQKEQLSTIWSSGNDIIKLSKLSAIPSLESQKSMITSTLMELANELWQEKKKDPSFI